MRLSINTTHIKVYRQIVEIIRSIPPLNKLRNRELDVLSIIMYYNYKYRNIEKSIRWRVINDQSTRREMQDCINMTEAAFVNNISILRKIGVILKDGTIPSFLQLIVDNKYEVKFIFNIEEDGIQR